MCLCYVLSRECLYDLSNTLTYITVCSTSLMYQCSLDLIQLCSGNNTLLSASCTPALLADAAVCLTDDGTTGGQQYLRMVHCTGVCYIPPTSLQEYSFNWYVNLMVSKLNVLIF